MCKRRGHKDCEAYLLTIDEVRNSLGSVHVGAGEKARLARIEEAKRRELFAKHAKGMGRRVEDRRDKERARAAVLKDGSKVRWLKTGAHATVKYVGPVDYTSGTFVGIEFDEDDAGGKHSGIVKGREYFDCAPKRGLMVQASDVQLDGADYAKMPTVDKPPKAPTASLSYLPDRSEAEQRRLSRMSLRKEHVNPEAFSGGGGVADRLRGVDRVDKHAEGLRAAQELSR